LVGIVTSAVSGVEKMTGFRDIQNHWKRMYECKYCTVSIISLLANCTVYFSCSTDIKNSLWFDFVIPLTIHWWIKSPYL
jgi:hypothetical protein